MGVLYINGSLGLNFYDETGEEVSEAVETEIIDRLQTSEYVINLAEKTVSKLTELNKSIYTFDFEVYEGTDYEFHHN